MNHWAQFLGISLASVAWMGCGATTHPPTHDDFSTMQVLEARTFEAASVATNTDLPCVDTAPALERCDHAQESLCLLSEELDDHDVAYWCEGASRRCREARSSWRARCHEPVEGAAP